MITEYVALVIAFKNEGLLLRVLNCLASQTLLPRRVIVVDNGGTLSECDRATWPLADRLTFISRTDNPGYGAAVNLARSELGDSALLVLTHDAYFEMGLARKLLDGLQLPNVGATGPILRYSNAPDRIFSAGGKLSKSGRAKHFRAPQERHPYLVDWLDGATVMYAPQALAAIDWLDEGYFLYFEDVDTCWRLGNAGFINVVVPAASGLQQPGAHPPYLGMRNMALFARKAGISRARHLLAVIPRIARESASRLRRGQRPSIGAAVHGLCDGYAGKKGPVES